MRQCNSGRNNITPKILALRPNTDCEIGAEDDCNCDHLQPP